MERSSPPRDARLVHVLGSRPAFVSIPVLGEQVPMRKIKRRWVVLGLVVAALAVVPTALWVLLTYEPEFYRNVAILSPERRQTEAKKFVAQSLQLRNDIVNEPRWEAAFTDEEVNAWLAEDLVTHFADQIPEGVHEPRVVFELDRVNLGFQLDQGPVRSVVWVVARVRVPGENELALTIEKIRAGVVPIPAAKLLDRITETAIARGLDVRWEHDGEFPVAIVKYSPSLQRRDVVLEKLQVFAGQIRLAGRSSKGRAVASPSLPNRRVLQSAFPGRKQKDHAPPPSRTNMASPLS